MAASCRSGTPLTCTCGQRILGTSTMQATGASSAAPSARVVARPRVVAWTTWLISIGLALAALGLILVTAGTTIPNSFGFRGSAILFAVTFATVGSVIMAGRPANRVGWTFVAAGMLSGLLAVLVEYATVGLIASPGSLPGATWAAWLSSWIWVPLTVLGVPVFLLIFPDGDLPTLRWRWVLWMVVLASAVACIGIALTPGPLLDFGVVENPIGIMPAWLTESLALVFWPILLGGIILAAGSVVLRYRRAAATERLQLRWVAAAAVLIAIVAPISSTGHKLAELAFIFAILSLPVAAGIAILRYRLYEIDLIINRALVYGSLTAIVAGIYTASIALMQRAFVALTGETSDAAIVVTTLVVVTAFTPIKNRIQAVVDRRFKEVRDPSAPLDGFAAAIEDRMWRLEPDGAVRRLLDVATSALQATGGRVRLGDDVIGSTGDDAGAPEMVVVSGHGSSRITLSICSRPAGPEYQERDRAAVTRAVEALARSLAAPG